MSLRALFRLWQLVVPQRGDFLKLLALSLLAGLLLALVDPIALKLLIESLESADTTRFVVLAGVILAVATIANLAGYWGNLVGRRLQNGIHADISQRMVDAYYHQPLTRALGAGEGYHVNRIHEEARELARSGAVLCGLASRIVQLIAALAVAVYLSWQVTLILLLIVPALVGLSQRYGGRISQTESQRHEAEAGFRSLLGRAVSAYRSVLLFGLRPIAARRLREELGSPLRLSYENMRHAAGYGALSGLFFSYSELTVILVAGSQVMSGALSIGALFGFMRAYQIVMQQVNGLAAAVPVMARLQAALDRAEDYVRASQTSESETAMAAEEDVLLAAEGMRLGWQPEAAFPALSFRLPRGQWMRVEGGNGSGKSTFALFACGFLQPLEGQWQRPPMARTSASFADSGFLAGPASHSFEGLCDSEAGAARVHAITASMQVAHLLERDVRELSRGQTARLQVALALSKPADLFVFDEPLANVDEASKPLMVECIRRFTSGSSVVLITHGDSELFGHVDILLRLDAEPAVTLVPHTPLPERECLA